MIVACEWKLCECCLSFNNFISVAVFYNFNFRIAKLSANYNDLRCDDSDYLRFFVNANLFVSH